MQHRVVHSSYTLGSVMCYTDGYILSANGEIIYLSIFGGQMELKTITAQILQGWHLNIYEDANYWQYVTQIARGRKVVRPWSANMVGNVNHKVFFCLREFAPWKWETDGSCVLAYGSEVSTAKDRLFRIVDSVMDIPLSPQWKDWIWSVCEDIEIQKFGEKEEFRICRYAAIPDDLEERLLEDLRSGVLTLN